MKQNVFIFLILFFATTVWSQENMFTISGGYSFANVEDVDSDATGFRINGLFEVNPSGGKIAHGFSIGYIGTSGEGDVTIRQQTSNTKLDINTWPIYYAPKIMFGEGSAKGFIKGALGWQYSGIKYERGDGSLDTFDSGFYGGLGLGFMKSFNEKMFLNLEYEWAYMGNSYYRDGFMNTVMLGLGMKF